MSSIEARGKSGPGLTPILLMIFSICPGAGGAVQSENLPRQRLIVEGNVILEDGTPPPFGVVIERDCGQGFRKEIETETSGYFLFEMGGRSLPEPLPGDFSAGEQSPWDLAMQKREQPAPLEINFCDLRARMQGYRSTVVRITGDPGSRKIDVGKIVLHTNRKTGSSVVDTTSLKAPQSRKAMERAQKAARPPR